ncbi:MAG: hypothetical protein M3Z23_06475 [Acidobacteriota bacterium]|nr:hypothetical protein [Acidobacteriota bacterium]
MTRKVFVDTWGGASFFVNAEASNRIATELMKGWRSENVSIVTTNDVLVELAALLARPLRIPAWTGSRRHSEIPPTLANVI